MPTYTFDDHDYDALYKAADSGHVGAVCVLLEHGADPNTGALHTAVSCGSAGCVEQLLEAGADVYMEDVEME